ncbi:sensor histidine kinase [Clostridium arbusti]|uniref:sensor histidine kinase n=1 Tax=Clostridium arbusti TaxID=1137848 RepID=UPI000288311F|nr:PAS domain S-box protein [Clostridium arbusti]
MKYTLKKKTQEPFVHSKNGIIIEVNNEFINFTGYSRNESTGKSLYEISSMLRLNSQIYLESIQDEYICYMFTKSYEPREVTIFCKCLECENEKMYFFKEKANSRIENKFHVINKLLSDNKVGIGIYSASNSILLTANQLYLDLLGKFYDKKEITVGKKISEFVHIWEGSKAKEVWMNVVNTGESFYGKEIKIQTKNLENYYIDNSIISVIENGKVKYIISTVENVTEKVLLRKNSEEQAKVIQQQKEELEAIIKNISDEVFIVHKDGRVVPINEMARKTLYQLDTNMCMKEAYKAIIYYDLEGNIIPFEELPSIAAFRGKIEKNKRILVKMPHKEIISEVSSSPIFNEDGNVSMVVTCMHDITDLVNKEKIIKQQKEELDAIIENMSDSLIIFDKNSNYTTFNKAARDTFLIESEKVNKIGDSLKQYEYLDVNKRLITCENLPAKRVINGEKLLGYRMIMKINDSVVYADINGTPIYDNEGNFIAGILCFRDVTEKIKHEENLLIKTQYNFLNRMIDNLDLPVLRLSYPDFKITDINQKAYNFVKGLKPEIKSIASLKGQNYTEIMPDCDKGNVLKHIKNMLEKKETSYIKYRSIVASGKEMFVNKIYQPVVGLKSEVTEIVVIVIDVTKEIKAKRHIEENLKMQEEFLANITHELKTPLNVIFSSSQLFELYLKNDSLIANKDKITKIVYSTRQNCYRLTKLISNIVDLSKIESGFFELNLSNENIVYTIEDIVQSVSEYVQSKGMSITFDTDTEEKIIACDTDKIERIILNLISNAIKFSEPGDEIYVDVFDKDGTVEISVKDNGIGIDKDHLDIIFERFKQVDKSFARNVEGSGIGLCLVKSIVELHGGKISVESKLGKGSKFKIELPSRTIIDSNNIHKNKPQNGKIEMINIEFSDIYS